MYRSREGIYIWLFNIGAESVWFPNKSISMDDPVEDMIVNRMEEIILMLCQKQDIIVMRFFPDNEYLKYLDKIGFSISNILIVNNDEKDSSKSISELLLKDISTQNKIKEYINNKSAFLIPYAITDKEEKLSEFLGLELLGSKSNICKEINNKAFARQLANSINIPTTIGKLCKTNLEVIDTFMELTEKKGFKKVILKKLYGASGRGLFIFESKIKLIKYLKHFLNIDLSEDMLIVEGWYEDKIDINYQFYISKQGDINFICLTEQILKGTVYIGSKFSKEIKWYEKEYLHYANVIGKKMYEMGYYGLVSIDSLILNGKTIIPIIEINGRFSLSTYLINIQNLSLSAKFCSKYYRVLFDKSVNYSQLLYLLDCNNLLYNNKTKEGVIIYIASTLPSEDYKYSTYFSGRIFALFMGDSWEIIDEINEKFNLLIKKIAKNKNSIT